MAFRVHAARLSPTKQGADEGALVWVQRSIFKKISHPTVSMDTGAHLEKISHPTVSMDTAAHLEKISHPTVPNWPLRLHDMTSGCFYIYTNSQIKAYVRTLQYYWNYNNQALNNWSYLHKAIFVNQGSRWANLSREKNDFVAFTVKIISKIILYRLNSLIDFMALNLDKRSSISKLWRIGRQIYVHGALNVNDGQN